MLRYQKVEEHIRNLLASSGYTAGDRLPSERDLGERLGVNRLTVRRAVKNLIALGLLEGNGTGGTRVAPPRMIRPLEVARSIGVHRVIAGLGGTSSNRLLHFEITRTPGAHIASKLKLAEDDEVVLLRRVWSIDATPFCLETTYLAAHLLPGLAADDLVAGQSLYATLRAKYGYETVNAERTISIAYVDETEAHHLSMKSGQAALALRVMACTTEDQPIEFTVSLNNPNYVEFSTKIPATRAETVTR
jgi:GntR family transcriptional regulator